MVRNFLLCSPASDVVKRSTKYVAWTKIKNYCKIPSKNLKGRGHWKIEA
jgi:hypothetical protein